MNSEMAYFVVSFRSFISTPFQNSLKGRYNLKANVTDLMKGLCILQVHLSDLEPIGVVRRRTFDLRTPWQRAPWLHARTDKLGAQLKRYQRRPIVCF